MGIVKVADISQWQNRQHETSQARKTKKKTMYSYTNVTKAIIEIQDNRAVKDIRSDSDQQDMQVMMAGVPDPQLTSRVRIPSSYMTNPC